MHSATRRIVAALMALSVASLSSAQSPSGAQATPGRPAGQAPAPQMAPEQLAAAQQAAMAKLSVFDGIWRGKGSMSFRAGEAPHQYAQVVRVGSLFEGMVKVFEIYGYLADGKLDNHQLNMVTYDAQKRRYVMLARGGPFSNTFGFELTDDGYVWAIGDAKRGIRFTASLKNGIWKQVAEGVSPDKPPVQMAEWTLHRVGSTSWPEGTRPKAH